MNTSAYDFLEIETINADSGNLKLQNISFKPKFTKQELSAKIAFERDHIQLQIPSLELLAMNFSFNKEKGFITVEKANIINPQLKVFRDKRIADESSVKSLYSKMLRDLSFRFLITDIELKRGYISYSERVENTDKAGEIFFDNVNASLKNLTNIDNKESTIISASSDFMSEALMDLDLSFDVTDDKDTFMASGQFKDFNAHLVNDFFKSNLNAKAEGVIEQIYFTFNGNKIKSTGDLKIKYKEFKFKILNNKNHVNKLLTAIGNLFINDGSKTDNKGYRHGIIKVDRQTNKSFFNYLWINVEDGLINALTGKEK
ncbi:hypothetical protein [Aureibaculum luteum]|uniref:hypothetical protein n=1 Tax=Aureibaculum luteum TaxID=1548456 RepID=UPI000E4BB6B7|nr:hypothetical protein [Aureibaculum luteum]